MTEKKQRNPKFYRHHEIDCTERQAMKWRKDINCLAAMAGYDARARAEILQLLGLARDIEVKPEYVLGVNDDARG